MATPILPRNRQRHPPGRHTPLKIHKGLLENRRDANGQALLQVSVVGNVDRNETSLTNSGRIEEDHLQAALASHTVQIPIPGSVRLVENYAELYPNNRWMDTTTYLHSTQTISEACSAALLNHDYTYYMDESDKMWLDNTNYQCRVEERIAQEPREDEFELVMGLFETLTGPQLHQELPDFSIFKPFFLAPLHPDTFASHVVPSWIRPPSVLSSIALTIYPHWHQRRSLRGGRKICPSLNTEEDDHINAAYVCFRKIPIRTRRVQKSKASEGTAGQLKAESSVQPLANEREKFENVSPRRSQRLKPQGREEQEPLRIMQSYATKVPVGSGAPGPSRDSGTSHLQVSIKHKVSSARMTTSHPTSDTKAPQKAQSRPLTREGTSTDRTRNVASTSGSGSQKGVPRSLRTSTTPKMSQTLIQLGPHEISSSMRHDHEGFALPPSLPECVQGLLRVDEINYKSVVIDPELRVRVVNNHCRHREETDVAVFRNIRQQQQGQNLRLWILWGISTTRKAGFFSRSAAD
ncbi:hypothetical protein B0H11DRAFT_1916546 [Mycena galericulata]|nr:hypothetical protein B0H11DRAFT_1916546 [Mycena galericulata]